MALDITGTNTEKTEKLVEVAVRHDAMLKRTLGVVAFCLPVILVLFGYIATQLHGIDKKVDVLTDRVGYLDKGLSKNAESIEKLTDRTGKLELRVERIDQRIKP